MGEPGPLEIVIARSAGGPGSPLLALGRFPLPATAGTVAALAAENGPDRRARAAHYAQLADRCRCLAAGALVRALAGADAHTDRDGKPYLPDSPDRHVSIAHSGPWAVCAVHDGLVGVDVEDLAGPADPAMAATFMAPGELARYGAQCDAAARQAYFFDVWTAKEAYIKAVGGSVRFAPESVIVPTEPHLKIWRDTLPGGFRLALVWKDP
jgi:phosphopantetheinyl transferase